MNPLSPQMYYDGKEKPSPPPLDLKAGPITAIFQPELGFLRYLRIGDHEIVRGIYGAVRDSNWDTIEPAISNLQHDIQNDSFKISFQAECQRESIHFVWNSSIQGESSGRITYEFRGEAKSTFYRNRIGLCTLHPITECSGRACTIEHGDGTLEEGQFPKFISPEQPFKDIHKITYEPAPGVKAEIQFQGEEFEMEDQRNWTDASFKTYGTPLALPFPAQILAGTKIQQSVTVSLVGTPRKILPILLGRDPQLSISTTPILKMPALGLGCSSLGQALSTKEIERLKSLHLSHLRTEVRLDSVDWTQHFDQNIEEANQLGLDLHVALHLGPKQGEELKSFKDYLLNKPTRVSLWMLHDESNHSVSEQTFQLAKSLLSEINPHALFATGSLANFAELNRNRMPKFSTALPCYSISPQVHATDNVTMVESLAAQAQTIESALQFAPRSIVLSPITLKHRFNSNTLDKSAYGTLPEISLNADPRQMSLFGAGWTLGSIARLATTGHLHSLTYFETTGCKGIIQNENQQYRLTPFSMLDNCVYPAFHLFKALVGFDRICPTHSSHPLHTEGLTLVNAQGDRRILVANLISRNQDIKIKSGTCSAKIKYLDETNVYNAMIEPEQFDSTPGITSNSQSGKISLNLRPYALAQVDLI